MASRSVVGLDIGSSGIRGAQMSFNGGSVVLDQVAELPIESGLVRGGEVLDPAALAPLIKQLWAISGFSSKNVVVGVSNQKVVVRETELPYLAPEEMRRSLAYNLSDDDLPIPVSESLLDYYPLEDFENGTGEHIQRMLLVAAARDMVEKHVSAATGAGLNVERVDLNAFAVLRSLASPIPPPDALERVQVDPGEAIVDIGTMVTNIVVHGGALPRFVRILPQGGGTITKAVAEQLNVPTAEAESLKTISALPLGGASHPAAPVVASCVGDFVEEVRSTLDYYMSQKTTGRLDRVVITGGGALLGGLAGRLSTALRMPVVQGRPLAVIPQNPKSPLTPDRALVADSLGAVAIGLALGAL